MYSTSPWDQTETHSSLEVAAAVVALVVPQTVVRDIHSAAVDIAVAASCFVAHLAVPVCLLHLELDTLADAFQVAAAAAYQETAVEAVLQNYLLDSAVGNEAVVGAAEAAVVQSLAAVEQ